MRKLDENSHGEHKLLLQCPFYNGGWQSAEAELFSSRLVRETSCSVCPADLKREKRTAAKNLR